MSLRWGRLTGGDLRGRSISFDTAAGLLGAQVSPNGGGGIRPPSAGRFAYLAYTMAAYLHVKNWDRFQKQHTSEYIRLYTALLYDAEFNALPPLAQLLLLKTWLCAAARHGQVSDRPAIGLRQAGLPYSSRYISYWQLLVSKGFLTIERETEETEERDRNLPSASLPLAGSPAQDNQPQPEQIAKPASCNGLDNNSLHNRYDVSQGCGKTYDVNIFPPDATPNVHTSDPPRSQTAVDVSSVSDGSSQPQNGAPPKRKRAAGKPRETWLTPIEKVWEEWNGVGSFKGQIGLAMKHLAPLYEAHGSETLAAHVEQYLAETNGEPQYRSLPKFASNFASYAPKPPIVNGVPAEWLWKATQ